MATNLTRTPASTTDAQRKTWTYSVWIKPSNILSSGNGGEFAWIYQASGGSNAYVRMDSNYKIRYRDYTNGGSPDYLRITNRLFRDPSAWYHVVLRNDTTQSTAADRVRLYVNGELQEWQNATQPAQNHIGFINSTFPIRIGESSSNALRGSYLAQVIMCAGQSYAPTVFGSTNANGIWIPNSQPSITYGTNGFKLDFAGTGASADASGFGADSSGNGNHFASSNLGTNPSTTDTCVNNFATFNPLDNDTITGAATLSNGNTVINANSDAQSGCPSTIAVSKGKWYIEGKCLSSTFEMGMFGYGDGYTFNAANHPPYGDNGYPFAYEYGGSLKVNNSNVQTGLATFTTNDILALALDMDNNTIKFFKNNTQVGTTITDSNLSTFAPYTFYVANHTGSNTNMFSLNTGNPSYTISSGNADANGYGNFEYAVPSGYYALCTKNLALYGG